MEPLEYTFWSKIRSRRWQCDMERFAVMQHPTVRSLWQDTMNPFSESLKDLGIVLLINCLSLRHEFRVNNTWTVEITN